VFNTIEASERKLIQNNRELMTAYEQLEITNKELNQQYKELRIYSEDLKVNEDRLNRAQALAHVGNWEFDLETDRIWASPESYNIYGIKQDAMDVPL
jgi:PAS domain-containing protein